MPNGCTVAPWFRFIVRCTGECPPGAGDKCTSNLEINWALGGVPGPWKTEPHGWRIRRRNEDYRCECLRPKA
jgi:hypothetical protein